MKILRTLVQLTTTATLTAGLLNAGSGAFAATIASNSTDKAMDYSFDCSTDYSAQSRVVRTTLATSRFEARAQKYEPDPNGNPQSDGTGTR
jgi:hypothetical protein